MSLLLLSHVEGRGQETDAVEALVWISGQSSIGKMEGKAIEDSGSVHMREGEDRCRCRCRRNWGSWGLVSSKQDKCGTFAHSSGRQEWIGWNGG